MDSDLLAGILGAALGLVGVGAALWVVVAMQRGTFSRWTASRSEQGIAPVSREVLLQRLLALDDPSQPFSYRPDERYDVRAEWKIADSTWWGLFQKNRLSETYLARVYLADRFRELRIVEERGRLEWSAGTAGLVPRVSWNRRFFKGIVLFERSREIAYGIADPRTMEPGKVVDYDFDVWRIKGPILRTAVESGWTFCPVVSEGQLTANRPMAG